MAGPGSAVNALLNFDADLNAVSAAERSIKGLNRKMRNFSQSSIAVQATQRDLNRQLQRVSASATGASGSFAAYQTSVLAAAAANKTLESNTRDLDSAFASMEPESIRETIDQLGNSMADASDEAGSLSEMITQLGQDPETAISPDIEIPDDAAKVMDDFDEDQFRQLFEWRAGDADTPAFLEHISEDRIDAINEATDRLYSLHTVAEDSPGLQHIWKESLDYDELLSDASESIDANLLEMVGIDDLDQIIDDAGLEIEDRDLFESKLKMDILDVFDVDREAIDERLRPPDLSTYEKELASVSPGFDPTRVIDEEEIRADPDIARGTIPQPYLMEFEGVEVWEDMGNIDSTLIDMLGTPSEELDELISDVPISAPDDFDGDALKERVRGELLTQVDVPSPEEFDEMFAEEPDFLGVFGGMGGDSPFDPDVFEKFRDEYIDVPIADLPGEIRDPETGQIERHFEHLGSNLIGGLDEELLAHLEQADIETVGDLIPEDDIRKYTEFYERLKRKQLGKLPRPEPVDSDIDVIGERDVKFDGEWIPFEQAMEIPAEELPQLDTHDIQVTEDMMFGSDDWDLHTDLLKPMPISDEAEGIIDELNRFEVFRDSVTDHASEMGESLDLSDIESFDWFDQDVISALENISPGDELESLLDVDGIEEFSNRFNDALKQAGREDLAGDFDLQKAGQRYAELAGTLQEDIDPERLMPEHLQDVDPSELIQPVTTPTGVSGRDTKDIQKDAQNALRHVHERMWGDGQVLDDMLELEQLQEQFPEIRDIIATSPDPESALANMADQHLHERDLFEFQKFFEDNEDLFKDLTDHFAIPDNVDVGEETLQDLQKQIRGSILQASDDEELIGIQEEMMSNLVANLDSKFLQNVETPDDVPITDSMLRHSLLQEMLDAEDGSPRHEAARGLLEHLQAGQIDIAQTIFQDETTLDTFQQELAGHLPDEFLDVDGLLGEEGQQIGVHEAIGQRLRGSGVRHVDMIQDPERIISEVSRAMEGVPALDDPHQIERASQAVQRVVEDQQHLFAREAGAEGLQMASAFDEDHTLSSLMPGAMDDVDNASNYVDEVDDVLAELSETQDNAKVLLGADTAKLADAPIIGGIFGAQDSDRRRRRGLSGYMLRRLAEATSRIDSFGVSTGHTGRSTRSLVRTLNNANRAYNDLLPLLGATSIRLGSVNVDFETMGIMVFKLTSMLGPLVAALGGVASGLGTAAAGAASFIGTGALEYFNEMEETMAGVNDRQEAMGEFMEHIKDMGWQALEPIRTAEMADGRTGMQLFEDTVRGALGLLHRFARAMARLAEMPVVAEELSRISRIIHRGAHDETFVEALETAIETVLPLAVDFFDAFVSGTGGFVESTSEIAELLGSQLLPALQNSSTAISLMVHYGTGFITLALATVRAVTSVIDAFTRWLEIIPGLSGRSEDLMLALGGLIGVMNMVTRMSQFLSARWEALRAGAKMLSKANSALTLTTQQLATAKSRLNLKLKTTAALLGAALMSVLFIREAINSMDDSPLYAMITGLLGLAMAFQTVRKAILAYNSVMALKQGRQAAATASTQALTAAKAKQQVQQAATNATTLQAAIAQKKHTLAMLGAGGAIGLGAWALSGEDGPLSTEAGAGVAASAMLMPSMVQLAGKTDSLVAAQDRALRGITYIGTESRTAARSIGTTLVGAGNRVRTAFMHLIGVTYSAIAAMYRYIAAATRKAAAATASAVAIILPAAVVIGAILLKVAKIVAIVGVAITAVIAIFYALYRGIGVVVGAITSLASFIASILGMSTGGSDGDSSSRGSGRGRGRGGGDERSWEIDDGELKEQNPFDVNIKNFGRSARRDIGAHRGNATTGSSGGRGQEINVEIVNNGFIGNRDFKRMVRDELEDEFRKLIKEEF